MTAGSSLVQWLGHSNHEREETVQILDLLSYVLFPNRLTTELPPKMANWSEVQILPSPTFFSSFQHGYVMKSVALSRFTWDWLAASQQGHFMCWV